MRPLSWMRRLRQRLERTHPGLARLVVCKNGDQPHVATRPPVPRPPLPGPCASSPPGATQTSVPLAVALGGPGLPADKHETPAGPPEGPNPPGPLRLSLCALQMDGPCLSARWDRGIYVLKSRFRKLTRVEEQFFHNKSCLQHPGCSAADCRTLSFSQGSEAHRVPETLVPSWDRGCDGGMEGGELGDELGAGGDELEAELGARVGWGMNSGLKWPGGASSLSPGGKENQPGSWTPNCLRPAPLPGPGPRVRSAPFLSTWL